MFRRIFLSSLVIFHSLAFDLNETICRVWSGILERNAYAYTDSPFMIHRPYSETPNDAVSEGLGYGLFLAYFCDDEHHFQKLLQGAETTMWNGHFYDWRVDASGYKISTGAATDAEQDIAICLILADRRVQTGQWKGMQDSFYAKRAKTIVTNFWQQGVTSSGTVRAGYFWGGDDFVNPGYLAPAWYREFAKFDSDSSHDWNKVVERSYEIIRNSPGYSKGLVPDWMTPTGGFTWNLGYNAYGNGQYFYKDAIRIFWRLGIDYVWNKEPRAKTFLQNAHQFLMNLDRANFYQMDGKLVPEGDIWIFDGGQKRRPRQEHSPLTMGMWIIPYFLMGTPDEKIKVMNALARLAPNNQTFWGNTNGSENVLLYNEMYFEQFLCEFGALLIAQNDSPSD